MAPLVVNYLCLLSFLPCSRQQCLRHPSLGACPAFFTGVNPFLHHLKKFLFYPNFLSFWHFIACRNPIPCLRIIPFCSIWHSITTPGHFDRESLVFSFADRAFFRLNLIFCQGSLLCPPLSTVQLLTNTILDFRRLLFFFPAAIQCYRVLEGRFLLTFLSPFRTSLHV